MKKILSLLFSVAFLLVFVSFFSQKSLATSCTPDSSGNCTASGANGCVNLSCPTGTTPGICTCGISDLTHPPVCNLPCNNTVTKPAAPNGLSASHFCVVTNSEAILSWSAVSGATYYNLDYTQSTVKIVKVSGTGTTISGLTDSKQTSWSVAACNTAGCSNSTGGSLFTSSACNVKLGIGSSCTDTTECKANLVCAGGKCLVSQGATGCGTSNANCVGGLVCSSNKCIKPDCSNGGVTCPADQTCDLTSASTSTTYHTCIYKPCSDLAAEYIKEGKLTTPPAGSTYSCTSALVCSNYDSKNNPLNVASDCGQQGGTGIPQDPTHGTVCCLNSPKTCAQLGAQIGDTGYSCNTDSACNKNAVSFTTASDCGDGKICCKLPVVTPKGYHDGASCTPPAASFPGLSLSANTPAAWGWACVPGSTAPVSVNLRLDSPTGTDLGTVVANLPRNEANFVKNSGCTDVDHGWKFNIPSNLQSVSHKIYALAVGSNVQLSTTPHAYAVCVTPPPPCTSKTGDCIQIDANHCGTVGHRPVVCGQNTTWESCTIKPQTCQTGNTCNPTANGDAICSPTKPTAPTINSNAVCVSATSDTLSWTNGANTIQALLYYCNKTLAAATKGSDGKPIACTRDKTPTNGTTTTNNSHIGWYLLAGNAATTSSQTLTGLTTGHDYTWFVRAFNGSHSNTGTPYADSADGNFTAAACTVACTAPQKNPHFECQNNTCVSVPSCNNDSGGCTAAGGSCGITPTPTITLTPTPTLGPTPTPVPGDTVLKLSIGLDGIGTTGDNVNADWTPHVQAATQFTQANTSGSNQDPLTPTRSLRLDIIDSNGSPVGQALTPNITFVSDNTSPDFGKFVGTVDLGSSFATGDYTVKVTTDAHLRRLIGGTTGVGAIQKITAGQTETLTGRLVAGDVDSNNVLNIQDYNILMSCIHDATINNPDNGALCAQNASYATWSDLYDNGVIDNRDYRLFLREYSVQNGD